MKKKKMANRSEIYIPGGIVDVEKQIRKRCKHFEHMSQNLDDSLSCLNCLAVIKECKSCLKFFAVSTLYKGERDGVCGVCFKKEEEEETDGEYLPDEEYTSSEDEESSFEHKYDSGSDGGGSDGGGSDGGGSDGDDDEPPTVPPDPILERVCPPAPRKERRTILVDADQSLRRVRQRLF